MKSKFGFWALVAGLIVMIITPWMWYQVLFTLVAFIILSYTCYKQMSIVFHFKSAEIIEGAVQEVKNNSDPSSESGTYIMFVEVSHPSYRILTVKESAFPRPPIGSKVKIVVQGGDLEHINLYKGSVRELVDLIIIVVFMLGMAERFIDVVYNWQ